MNIQSMKLVTNLFTASLLLWSSSAAFGVTFLNKKDPNRNHPELPRTSFLCQGSEKNIEQVDYPWGLVREEALFDLINRARIMVEDPSLKERNKADNRRARFCNPFRPRIHPIEDDWRLLDCNGNMSFGDFVKELERKRCVDDASAYERIDSIISSIQRSPASNVIRNKSIKDIRVYESYYFYRDNNHPASLQCNTAQLKNQNLFSNQVITYVVVDGKVVHNGISDQSFFQINAFGEVKLGSNVSFTVDLSRGRQIEVTATSIINQTSVVIHQFHVIGYTTQTQQEFVDSWRDTKGYLDFEEPLLEFSIEKNSFSLPAFEKLPVSVAKLEKTFVDNQYDVPFEHALSSENFGTIGGEPKFVFSEDALKSVYAQYEDIQSVIFDKKDKRNIATLLALVKKENQNNSRQDAISQKIAKIDTHVEQVNTYREKGFLVQETLDEARMVLLSDLMKLYEWMLSATPK